MKNAEISVSILDADFAKIGHIIEEIEEGEADSIHLDIMDGHFVPNLSFGPGFVKSIRKLTDIELDAHLMVERPGEYLERFADAGCGSLIVHLESDADMEPVLDKIEKLGLKAGLALNPATDLHGIDGVAGRLDKILIMTVNPGFGGQKFIMECIGKVEHAKRKICELGIDAVVGVDGGINNETGRMAAEAGADFLVAGSALLNSERLPDAIRKLRKECFA